MIIRGSILFLLTIFQINAFAQFTGGAEDGYNVQIWTNPISIFSGAHHDGYSMASGNNALTIFSGGSKDGYSKSSFTNSISIFAGGSNDGYHANSYSNPLTIFSGGSKDGYHNSKFTNTISIYSGGNKDGYASEAKLVCFIWTGSTGTGWNVSDNWQDGVIPNINSKVIIPSGTLNFPFINSGLMTIGQDLNSGLYLCKNITIDTGAEMTFRINAFLENYGTMDISGNVYILNQSPGAVKNLGGAHLNILNGGKLIFQ